MMKEKIGRLRTILLFMFIITLSLANPVRDVEAATKTESFPIPVSQFKDVPSTDANSIFISYLAEKSIINGFPDGTFGPEKGLTRAEGAVILVKAAALNLSPGIETGFSDVKADYWAADYIAVATKAGYIKGLPDGTFRPEEKLTRAQGISLVMRLSTQKDRSPLPSLNDMDPSHWAAKEMAVALAAGMIGLSADGKQIYPDVVMKRGSLARALGILLTKDPGLYTVSLAGIIKDVKGNIELIRNGTTTLLQNNSFVSLGDTIKTGNSSASIFYPDGSSVLIKENTEINIKESMGRAFIKKDGSSGIAVENVDIDLKKGTLFGALATKHESIEKQTARANFPLLAALDSRQFIADQDQMPWFQTAQTKKVKMTVDMPWGVAAVRGTFILVSVNQDGTCNVSCLTGSAEVSGTSGNTVSLGEGTSSGIVQGGTAGPAAQMSEQDRQAFGNVQDWVINTALQMDINKEATPLPIVEMILEIPNQPLPNQNQVDQVRNTLDVVLNALEASGIQLSEQTIQNLQQQIQEMGLPSTSLPESNTTNNTNNTNNGGGDSYNDSPIVSITYSTAGIYGGTSTGSPQTINVNVFITVPGVTLQNMVITRNLVLGAGIGNGEVTLNNVKVLGNTLVNGGGPNSVHLIDCDLYTVSVDTGTNIVRIVANGSTTVEALTLNSGAKLEEEGVGTGRFSSVTLSSLIPANAQIVLIGSFNSLNINAPGSTITLGADTVIQQLNANASVTIAGTGQIQSAVINAEPGSTITLGAGTVIQQLTANSAVTIAGTGQIQSAIINAIGVEMNQTPTTCILGIGVSSVSINNQTINRTMLDASQMTLNTVIGTGDSISFTDLAAESVVKVYDADVEGSYVAGTLSAITDGAATFFFTVDLGAAGKNIWVTVNTPPNLESLRVAIAAVAEPVGNGNFEGYIVNALNGNGVSGIEIKFRLGANNTTGDIAATVTTDNLGYYSVEGLTGGTYTGQTNGAGFSAATFNATCIAGMTTSGQNGTITPILSAGETRIVLTWGENPSDLDAYLTGPIPDSSSRFETYYANTIYPNNSTDPDVKLDRDDTDSYGPETITIYHQSSGDYIFSVHKYSGSGSLATSGAEVKIYRGSDCVATFNVPGQAGIWWTVFKLNGNIITPINYVSDTFEALGAVAALAHNVGANAKTFTPVTEGYAAGTQEAAVTVTVTAVEANSNITVALSGDGAGDFTLVEAIDTLADGATATFTVRANDGLAVGTHTATVTITSTEFTAGTSFTVTQVVNPISVPTAITAAIIDIAAPAIGGTPAATIAAGTGYTGTINWTSPESGNFVEGTPGATVVLTAGSGYTFTGMPATGAVTIAGTTAVSYVVSGTNGEILTITVDFAALSAASGAPTAITAATIEIEAPAIGGTPAATIAAGTGYTGTINWASPESGNFVEGTPGATVVLTAGSGYTFTGMPATGAVTIAGSTAATYVVSGTNGETLTITVGYAALALIGTIEANGNDTNVMMQADNKTVKDGDVFIFTLTNCTLKETNHLGEAMGVIEFNSLPAGMTYTVANIDGKLVVSFNAPASVAIGANIEMIAVIKPAAVTGSGAAVSEPVTVILQKNNETVAVAGQVGTITALTAEQTATFAVTTANITDGREVIIIWFTAADGTTSTEAPIGVTAAGSSVFNNASTITVTADNTSVVGIYYFKATIGGVTSAVVTVNVTIELH
jgi:hypothetical protein